MWCPYEADKERYEEVQTSPLAYRFKSLQLSLCCCTRKSLDINIYVKFKMAHKEVDPLMHFDLGRARMRAGRRKVSVFYHSAGWDLNSTPNKLSTHVLTPHFLISTQQHVLKNVTKMATFE